MVCAHCGNILPEGALICSQCGAQVAVQGRTDGLSGRRQGRPDKPRAGYAGSMIPQDTAPEIADLSPSRRGDAGRSAASTHGPIKTVEEKKKTRGRKPKRPTARKLMINWALLWTILLALCIVAAGAVFVFLKLTDQGQLILARMGRDANANAMWAYGQELLDQGYVDRSLEVFEQAYAMEPQREDIYDRLFQLADAYEAAGKTAEAEEVYTKLYTEIAPEDPEIYRQVVRLLENQNRRMELAAFLNLAYEKTGETSFRRQREELLPSTPTADQEAGVRKAEQDVALISAEDYDIYYILGDEGVLPEDGTLYESPIHLDEGTHVIRAVAVSTDLISDEMRIQYTINLPRPSAPYASLEPGVYERRQRIWLRYLETEDEKNAQDPKVKEKLKDITIYYTVDGQTPNSNSPIYTGEPFYLPLGKSTVKALAVNGYGKVSNVMERTYQVKLKFENYFSDKDNFADFTIMTTARDAFIKKFGTALDEQEIVEDTINSDCVLLKYSWGEARFYLTDKGYILYRVDTENPSMVGPRKTKIGMTETEITEKFRDMGQTYNQDGSRSIYYDQAEKKYGMMYHLSAFDDRIDYSYARSDNGVVTLSYYLENSRVSKMTIRCDFY